MIGWIILIVVLLILVFPIGFDAAYSEDERFLKLKIGPFRKTLLPRKKTKRPKKEKKEKEKPKPEEESEDKKKRKLSFTFDDVIALADIAFDTMRRFRIHMSVDRFLLYWTAAASDPYSAVQQFGKINAVLGVLMSKANNILKIRDEDVRTTLDLEAQHPVFRIRVILSIQIWQILLILICAGGAGLRWIVKKKRNERAAAAAAEERSTQDGEL